MLRFVFIFGWLIGPVLVAAAQPRSAPSDTLTLDVLQAQAVAQDPRAVQPSMLEAATQLRIAALRAARLPQLALTGQGTYQSDVPSISLGIPGASGPPTPPNEQFRAQAEAEWVVFDGGRTRQQVAVERARYEEGLAGIGAALHPVREATQEAYFGSLLLQARAQTLEAAEADLEARLAFLRDRAREGAALPADADALEAELISVQQQAAEAEADRRAALAVLSALTRQPIAPEAVLALPDPQMEPPPLSAVATLDPALEALVDRPEVERLRLQSERLLAEAQTLRSELLPQASFFGQAGVGRPNPYDFLSDEVQEYALVGVRLRWTLFDGGRARRSAAALREQARIVETEAAAFSQQITRALANDLADVARLRDALAVDARAVVLREEALRVAQLQLEEGVLLPPDYADRLSDLTTARLTQARHRIELAHAQARIALTLGTVR